MIDLERHTCLQGALREAFALHAQRLCLIEADRDKERCRLRYAGVQQALRPVAAALQGHGARRVGLLMTNQSKWHVAACAVFWIGAVLVPLDPKLSAADQAALLRHSGADALIVEHFLWRGLAGETISGRVWVTEAPAGMDLRGARRWEELAPAGEVRFVARERRDAACIVYSSGTGGRAKGCVLTHGNYLAQCSALLARYRFSPGDRYLSILPSNHAIDFMVGFFGPYTCGATVVHLRTLRPEFVRAAFVRYRIAYMALVPLVLRNLREAIAPRLGPLRPLLALHRLLQGKRPKPWLSRLLLRPVHKAFGGRLKTLFVGGAFTDPELLRFFARLGIPVANGYGLTEAGTAVTLNDPLAEDHPESVGRPLPGMEIRILDPGPDGVGEVAVRGPTVMARYLDDPELTAETIAGGWLHTGDLGRLLESGHLVLVGRSKNMIVTAGGKNVYPEDVEQAFEGLPVKENCIFAAHRFFGPGDERLLLVIHPDGRAFAEELLQRNRRLPAFKRLSGYLVWDRDFPRTASLKIKREALAEALRDLGPGSVQAL